jgi:hypothetical protein
MSSQVWVTPSNERWSMNCRSCRKYMLFDSKAEAVTKATDHSRSHRAAGESGIVVQGRDGRIEGKDSYFSDPFLATM